MAREINVDRHGEEWVFDGSGNCWYVHFASGTGALDWFIRQAPHPKPYLAWRRWRQAGDDRPELRIYKFETVRQRILKGEFHHGR